jgi:hypothetical protein
LHRAGSLANDAYVAVDDPQCARHAGAGFTRTRGPSLIDWPALQRFAG